MTRQSTSPSPRRRAAAAAFAASLSLALAACGSSDAGEEADDAEATDGPVELSMAVMPTATFAPIFVGINEGIFAEHGIQLEIDMGGLAPTVFPRILSGELDLAANTWGTLVTARAQDLPLVGIAPIDRGGDSPENDYQAVMVGADGPAALTELEGSVVGVPSLQSFTNSQFVAVLEEHGVDTSTMEFIALPFPDMPAALSSGQVDAVAALEPFKTIIEQQGGTALASFSRSQPLGAMVTSEELVADRPDDVRRFQEAWLEVLEYVDEHPDAVRAAMVSDLDIDPELAETMILPVWAPSVSEDEVQEISEMMVDVGAVSAPVPAGELMTSFPLDD